MIFQLDHLAVAGEGLEAASEYVEQSLGVKMGPGGQHGRFGTHNRLLGLEDGLYLEAIAVDPGAAPPQGARWFDLDRFSGPPRLANWICRVDDLDAALAALPQAGRAVDLARGDLRWRMAVPVDGILPYGGLFPALIQWQVDDLPGQTLIGSGCRMTRLELCHPEAAQLADMLAPHLSDDRVVFEQGVEGMRALFDTPQGEKVL